MSRTFEVLECLGYFQFWSADENECLTKRFHEVWKCRYHLCVGTENVTPETKYTFIFQSLHIYKYNKLFNPSLWVEDKRRTDPKRTACNLKPFQSYSEIFTKLIIFYSLLPSLGASIYLFKHNVLPLLFHISVVVKSEKICFTSPCFNSLVQSFIFRVFNHVWSKPFLPFIFFHWSPC